MSAVGWSDAPNGWTRIPNQAIADPRLDPLAFKVYVALLSHAFSVKGRRADTVWPSIGRLAQLCGVSGRSISRAIRRLQDAGYISVTQRHGGPGGGGSNLYEILPPPPPGPAKTKEEPKPYFRGSDGRLRPGLGPIGSEVLWLAPGEATGQQCPAAGGAT